jgi:N-acetyl-anhydromuramyl-L-alanine amidase AmpD
MRHIDLIVIHCSATKASADIGASLIDEWHRARGWAGGIGYHYVIRRSGEVESGRAEEKIGAHAYGYNKHSIGVCLVGGLDDNGNTLEGFDNAFTRMQKISLLGLMLNLRTKYPGADVQGHRDLSPDIDGDGVINKWEWTKECPCFNVEDIL